MRKKRKALFIIVAIILFISIGFAVLSTNLSINGLFTFPTNTWSIVLKSIVVDDTSVTKTTPTINQDEDTITFSAELNKPGDYYSFNVDVENNSTLDAMLASISTTGITSQYSDYLSCVVTYSNGVTPHTNDILYKTARVTFNIKLLYKDITTNQIPADTLNPTIQITINYRQANNNAVFVTDTNHWNFDYTGSAQTFTVPKTANYKIELWGAQGGSDDASTGGPGGYTKGNINFNKTNVVYFYVGQGGTFSETDNVYVPDSFNGGSGSNVNTGSLLGSGGGATDIRLTNGEWDTFASLKSRIMVASGGAPGIDLFDSYYNYLPQKYTDGAPGGGLVGYDGEVKDCAEGNPSNKSYVYHDDSFGGSQILGGKNTEYTRSLGSFGKAGTARRASSGGGGGYFGGQGGDDYGWSASGGGGGSSFISGHAGCVAIAESSTENNIVFKTDTNEVECNSNTSTTYNSLGYNTDPKCSIHYSTKVFTDTVMIDGAGYSWTTVKADTPTGMPNKDGIGTVMGNTGNGFAKITLIS